jgi:hypothetical protein
MTTRERAIKREQPTREPGRSAKAAARPAPRLVKVSEQMKAWSAALADEIGSWPQVVCRSFFGFIGLYRGRVMFAVLPRTRGLEAPNALAFRFDAPSPRLQARLKADRRISVAEIKKARWFSFELSSSSDLHDALGWLSRAYGAATGKKPR